MAVFEPGRPHGSAAGGCWARRRPSRNTTFY